MKMHHWSDSPTLRFTAPVIAENMATTSINMVVSSIIGGISASALAGVGLVNSFLNVITAAAAFLTTGAAVLVARIAGEGDERETSRAVGQAFLLAVLFGVAIMAICEILSAPIQMWKISLKLPWLARKRGQMELASSTRCSG